MILKSRKGWRCCCVRGALWEAFGKAVSLINVVLLVGKL